MLVHNFQNIQRYVQRSSLIRAMWSWLHFFLTISMTTFFSLTSNHVGWNRMERPISTSGSVVAEDDDDDDTDMNEVTDLDAAGIYTLRRERF